MQGLLVRAETIAIEGRCIQIHVQALHLIQRLKHIAVPQVPLDPLQILEQPYEDKKKVRVAVPFTVESLSPHRVLGVDENENESRVFLI
jgi:hypothetical protein